MKRLKFTAHNSALADYCRHIAGKIAWRIRRNRPLLVSAQRLRKNERQSLSARIADLGPWFHNMNLAKGVWTNQTWTGAGPDYPAWRWRVLQPLLPEIRAKRCLDVGCSSGFFSLKLKELGAQQVLGIDGGEQTKAIAQAKFAASSLNLDVRFENASVYDLGTSSEVFDVVLFLGVFYHLRHPLLALDSIRKVCRGNLLMQTITTPHEITSYETCPTYPVRAGLRDPDLNSATFPSLRFVEDGLDGDQSCWFVPSPNAVLAMLNSSGFAPETFIFPTEHEMIVRATIR